MYPKTLLALLAIVSFSAACGAGDSASEPIAPGNPSGMCADDVTDCEEGVIDAPVDEPMPVDGIGDGNPVTDEQAIDHAHGVLGVYEDLLPDDVRIGRRGDEFMALTEDYRPGRLTVQLDDTDGDGFRVTSVTVELANGPETFELEAS